MPSEGSHQPGYNQDIFSLLIDSVQNYAIILLDLQGNIKSWNKGAEIIKGYKKNDIIGQNFSVFYTEEDLSKSLHLQYLKEAAQNGHIQNEGWRVRKDGSRFWANVTITALFDANSKLAGYSKMTCDLTERKRIEDEKRANEHFLEAINEATRIGTWEVDLQSGTVAWSKVTYAIHEAPDDYRPTLNNAILFFKEGECRDIVRNVINEAITKGTNFEIEAIIITMRGKEIWCRSTAQTEFKDGKCLRLFGIFQDIDDQKRTQIELQLSEEHFRNSFDLSAIGMALVSPDAFPIRVNKRFCEILGYTHREFYSRSILDISHPDDIEADTGYARQLIDGEIDRYQMIKRYFHKNGSIVWTHLTVSLVRDAHRNPVHFISEVEDITEKKKAEDELRRINAELTAMFNSGARVSMISANLNGVITHFNKGAEGMLGYLAEEIIGKASPQLMHLPEEIAERGDKLSRLLGREVKGIDILRENAKTNDFDSGEWTYVRKDGSTLPVQLIVSSVKDDSANIVGYLGIATDITQIKEAEASIRKYALLEAKNKEMEQFTFIASHDLLEPLQTVSSFVGLLTEEYHDRLDPNAQKYINFISGSTKRMMELVKGLLHYSRLGRERVLTEVNCNELVNDVLENLGLIISESKAQVHISPMPTIQAYALELNQLFQNLIRNAIKFKKPDVPLQINISAQRENNKWIFTVADNGIGINEKNKEKIFVIFQRLHDRHEFEGTGIGLSYCKKIVELHNGNIWVKSTPGEGSAFYFTIMT
jgi:PAS domain S-box-containing protein